MMHPICPPKFRLWYPGEMKDKGYANLGGANKVHYGRCASGVLDGWGGGGAVTVYWVCQTRMYHSQIFDRKQFAAWIYQTLFLFLWENLIWDSVNKQARQVNQRRAYHLPACRRLLFPLLHAEKGRPFSACNKGNRRRLHASKLITSRTMED